MKDGLTLQRSWYDEAIDGRLQEGKRAPHVNLFFVKEIIEDLPNAQFVEIERCGHLPQEERPDDVVSLMRRFYKT